MLRDSSTFPEENEEERRQSTLNTAEAGLALLLHLSILRPVFPLLPRDQRLSERFRQACYNEALKACAEGGGRFERAASLLKEMRQAGVTPNSDSYRATLRACER